MLSPITNILEVSSPTIKHKKVEKADDRMIAEGHPEEYVRVWVCMCVRTHTVLVFLQVGGRIIGDFYFSFLFYYLLLHFSMLYIWMTTQKQRKTTTSEY